MLCAPTRRAARRMSEITGLDVQTIHRLLEVGPRTDGFKRDADNRIDCGLLVCRACVEEQANRTN